MQQVYHSNAKTNVHICEQIAKSEKTNSFLAEQFKVPIQTVSKWKNGDCTRDVSSHSHNIEYALTDFEKRWR